MSPTKENAVEYLQNTGLGGARASLPVVYFLDDWEPVGNFLLAELVEDNYIEIRGEEIFLKDTCWSRNSTVVPS